MFESMATFVEVVETGSFSAASKKLNKNASSIARQVSRLEQELGAHLLNRSTRRLELTLAGESFYQQAVEILRSLTQAKDSVKADLGDIGGSLHLTCVDSFGKFKIAALLPEFRKRYPNTQCAISLDNNQVNLYESHFDLAIRYGRAADSSLVMRPLLKDRMRLVASPAYLQQHAEIRHPEDIKQHECLVFHRLRQHSFWHFWQSSPQRQHYKIRVDGVLAACGGEPLVQWAKQGLGLTLMSEWIIQDDLAQGRLVEVLPQWQAGLNEATDNAFYMIWAPTRAQRPVVRAFIDFLAEQFESP